MRVSKFIIGVSSMLVLVASVQAADPTVRHERRVRYDTEMKFRGNELSFDVFGTAMVTKDVLDHWSGTRVADETRLGLGFGVNYFITRYIGVGADAWTENPQHAFVDYASGSAIIRLPIESLSMAPYVYGGGGYQWDLVEQSFAHAGAGVEFRLAKHAGIFLDGRYVFADKTQDYAVGRAGIRFVF